MTVAATSQGTSEIYVIELPFLGVRALPPNNGMQLTAKSVTPFAYAKAAPLLSAADPRRWA